MKSDMTAHAEPRSSELSERMAKLSPAQRQKLQERLRGVSGKAPETLLRKRPTLDYAMTPEQEHMWLLQRLDPSASYFNHSHVFRLLGDFELPVMQRAIDEVVRRHENLRTSFPEVNGKPKAVVAHELRVAIEVEEVDSIPAEKRLQHVQGLIAESICRPFDVCGGPLLRATIYRMAPRDHAALIVVHHLVTDFVSYDLIEREIFTLYNAYARDLPSPLESLPVQFGDFATWLDGWSKSEAAAKQTAYWIDKLDGVPRLDFPIDFPRPPFRTFLGERVHWVIDPATWDSFKQMAAAENVTRFIAILATYAAVISAHCGKDDITIAVPISNRKHSETANLIGYFLNTVAVRLDLSGDPTFREFLGRTRRTFLDAIANADVPFEMILSKLRIERDPSRSPLVETSYSFANDFGVSGTTDLPLTVQRMKGYYRSSWLDIDFAANDNDHSGAVFFDYNPDLFRRSSIERMMAHFKNLLAAASAQPERPISSLKVLSAEERDVLLAYGSQPENSVSSQYFLHSRFEEQTRRTPLSQAAIFGSETLSYEDLNRRSNQLARFLKASGIKPEDRVAVCARQNLDIPVAVLGIWKAGGVYVPIDPKYPQERLAFLLRDSDASVLLTQKELHMRLPVFRKRRVFLDDDWNRIAEHSSSNLDQVPLLPDNLAYIIYTSGSAGFPKGVGVSHSAASAHMAAIAAKYQFTDRDRVLQFVSLSFDVSIEQLITPLLSGAALVFKGDAVWSRAEFFAAVQDFGVTAVDVPPAYWSQLAEQDDLTYPSPSTLRMIIVGGDLMPLEPLRHWQQSQYRSVQLLNAYGPTETVVTATIFSIPVDYSERPGLIRIPIGAPIARKAYVLNDHLNLAPLGVWGELYLGGTCLARGYINNPSLTAERFVPDPISNEPGGRIYRTGDKARWSEDGNLEFLERFDSQVKVRGFRIEPGEISTVLLRYPGVSQAVVIAHEEPSKEKKLVGYVVPKPGYKVDSASLRSHAAQSLPDYMVPSALMVLDKLPLNPNGKLDSKALPLPDFSSLKIWREPKTRTENILSGLVSELLGVSRVSLDDNFFNLGGDSILAIQLVSRLRRDGLVLTLRDVFEQQTLEALARVLRPESRKAPSAAPEIAIGTVELTPIMHWFFERGGILNDFSQSTLIPLPALISLVQLDSVIQLLLDHHDALRSRVIFSAAGPTHLEIPPPGTTSARSCIQQADVEGLPEASVRRTILGEAIGARKRLKPAAGLMLQAVWINAGSSLPGWLLLTIHHFVVDGVSWRTILSDISSIVESLQAGRAPLLQPVPTSFREWAKRLLTEAHRPERVNEAVVWKEMLERPSLKIAEGSLDRNRDTAQTALHATFTLPSRITAPLLSVLPAVLRARINEILLASLKLALLRWTKQRGAPPAKHILVNIEGHGREDIFSDVDLSRTVGWFTSLYPVAFDVSDLEAYSDPANAITLAYAIRTVKSQLRKLPDSGLGFGLLRFLNVETKRELSVFRDAEIAFNYLGRFQTSEEPFLLGAGSDPHSPLTHAVELNAIALEGPNGIELRTVWSWAPALVSESSVRDLAESFLKVLEALVGLADRPDISCLTPSDLSLVSISQEEIERLEKKHGVLEEVLPLSPLQEGLLFHALFALFDAQAVDVYNVQVVLGLDGQLNREALHESVHLLLRRHSNLRAGFEHEGVTRPMQVIPRDARFPWRTVDLTTAEEKEREQQWQDLVHREGSHRFDLSNPPLFRFVLVRVTNDHHRLVITSHHILMDGWSMPVFVQELLQAYEQKGSVALLPRVTPYREYLSWLALQDRQASLEVMRNILSGVTEATRLAPAGYGHPTSLPQQFRIDFTEDVTRALNALARNHRLTLNTVIQGTWAVLLGRLTNRWDVVFGATVSGRSPEIAGIETIVGLFINTLPVRVQLSADIGFLDLLAKLQDQQSRVLAHQHVALMEIQQAVGLGELFDTLVVFENYPFDQSSLAQPSADVKVSHAEGHDYNHYPLTIKIIPGQRLHLFFEYRTDVLHRAVVEAIAARLVKLLRFIADTPDVPVRCMNVLLAEEQQLLAAFNRTGVPAMEATLPELFSKQVEATPQACAVSMRAESMSYAALNARANRLARHLLSLGVGPECFVGILLERSVELIVALLAVLKTGAAYLPLDPEYPIERLRFMLSDADPKVVISKQAISAKIAIACNLLNLDSDNLESALQVAPDRDPEHEPAGVRLRPDHPAYLIYTSGSTGRPKGVIGTHSAIVNRLSWMWRTLPYKPGEVCCQKTSLSFVDSVAEIFGPLLQGLPLYILDKDEVNDGMKFLSALEAGKITRLILVPSLLRQMLEPEYRFAARLPDLQIVISSGEALSSDLADLFSRNKPDSMLLNFYGSSEIAADATWSRIDGSLVTIGAPIDNIQAYVAGRGLELVPIGVIGELYIGGAGLARGYWKRPGLTAERFVANPWSEVGTRMYRTGDLARWRADGCLEFVGRADQQVKLRGQRIELEEIERAIERIEGIGQAAVAVQEHAKAGQQLVAYLTETGSRRPSAAELRGLLAQQLPEYMVPAAYVTLDKLPFTPNGKLDRRALPSPQWTQEAYREPRSPQEQILCQIFAEVLGLERIGIDDNFFQSGGHSLVVMRMVGRVRATLGIELDIRSIFEHPTVAGLVEHIQSGGYNRPALVATERPDRIPLSFSQERLWFLHRLEGPSATYNIAMALCITGQLSIPALITALEDVAARHEILRTIYPEQDGIPHQQILTVEESRPQIVFEEADESDLPNKLTERARVKLDLTKETPLRVWLFRAGPEHFVFLMVLHHIAGDGWSFGPLAKDVSLAYIARPRGEAPQFTPLPVQYADYALWQRALLGDRNPSPLQAEQLEFWSSALAGMPPEIDLPVDHPRPAIASYRGGAVLVRIASKLHHELAETARRHGATLFMVLQAAFAVLLSKFGAGDDIPVGTAIAGRGEEASEKLVGLFVNTLVLRTDLKGDPSFTELIARVRRFDLQAYAHSELPFERLVEALQPSRSLARQPLFQVMLVLHNTPRTELILPGLDVRWEPFETSVTKFDLTMNLTAQNSSTGVELGMTGNLEYSADLFERETAEKMRNSFIRVLEMLVQMPDAPLHRFELLAEQERGRLLNEFNATKHDVPEVTLTSLLEAQRRRTPDALAVSFGQETLSYAQLHERADQVAGRLTAFGAGPEKIVGVFLERGLDMVVALLAVLKTGASYLPLEPDYPAAWIASTLAEADPVIVLTAASLRHRVPDSRNVLAVDDSEPDPNFIGLEKLLPLHPAYVIYTSGSTGRPKGVVNTHGALVNRLLWMQNAYRLSDSDRVLQKTPFSFDVSVWEFFWPLLTGAALVVTPPGKHRDPAYLAAAIEESGITTLHFVPSMLAEFLNQLEGERFPHLRRVVCSGEELTSDLQTHFFRKLPHVQLHNLYGPTEAAIDVTAANCRPDDSAPRPSIGAPIDNIEAYVAGRGLELVPIGVTGELYIGGLGLARGYLKRPGLTAERFVANPWSEAGTRIYRTGDLARWRADGRLEFMGRADQQVKLRGQRIELEEIERALERIDGIGQAAVAVQEHAKGQQLVAYVIETGSRRQSAAELRGLLAQQLPEYMVPAAYVTLDRLPLTPNGKLNRRALPSAQWTQEAYREPRSPEEQILCQIFAEVLGLERIGIDDNFFQSGGHSLIATQVVSRVRTRLHVEIDLKRIFESPTVAELARHCAPPVPQSTAAYAKPSAVRRK